MSLRILIASDFYSPFIGGAERQVQLLSQSLIAKGHSVTIATVWHKGLPKHDEKDGLAVYRLKGLTTSVGWFSNDPKRRFHPPFADPGITLGLRRLINKVKPDVIHANGWIANSCAAALIGKDIPLLVSVRDYGYSCATRTLLHQGQICSGPAPLKCLECAAHAYGTPKAVAAVSGIFGSRAIMSQKISATHSVSTFVQQIVQRDLLGKMQQKKPRITIPDIVIPSFLANYKETLPENNPEVNKFVEQLPKEPFILFVGALQPHKGLTPLLAAYKNLDNPPPLVLIGSSWHDTPTEFPAGVTVLQNVPHAAVMVAWERSLFGVTPSVWPDPLPGVVREAMYKGKAVIATAVGGNLDMVVDGETGVLVPPGNVASLTAAMRKLLSDPTLCEVLGKAGQLRVRQFSATEVVPQFEQLYRQLVTKA